MAYCQRGADRGWRWFSTILLVNVAIKYLYKTLLNLIIFFKSLHMCSIGFILGVCTLFIHRMLPSSINRLVALDEWQGALSDWKRKVHFFQIIIFLKLEVICQYFKVFFGIDISFNKYQHTAVSMHPHTMTEPPSCFTVGMIQTGFNSSPIHLWIYMLGEGVKWWNIDSSDHITCFRCSWDHSLWSLTQLTFSSFEWALLEAFSCINKSSNHLYLIPYI